MAACQFVAGRTGDDRGSSGGLSRSGRRLYEAGPNLLANQEKLRNGIGSHPAHHRSRKFGAGMILETLWRVIQSQINKLANFFWESDPIAVMQAEYDHAVAQIREGRLGLEEYRSFVERVGRQAARHG